MECADFSPRGTILNTCDQDSGRLDAILHSPYAGILHRPGQEVAHARPAPRRDRPPPDRQAGQTYFLVVDGYGGDCGAYTLSVCENPPCLSLECAPGDQPGGEPAPVDGHVDVFNGACDVMEIDADCNLISVRPLAEMRPVCAPRRVETAAADPTLPERRHI